MPWYTNPAMICKVLGKIAKHYEQTNLYDLKSVLDNAIGSIFKKQEHYHEFRQQK